MAYFAPYLDNKGLHIPTYEDIVNELVNRFKVIYGNDAYLENDSQDYQFLSAIALCQYDTMQMLMLTYNNSNPVTAIGSGLDRICAFNGIVRNDKTYSIAQIEIKGVADTVLDYPSVSDVNGYIWQLPRMVIIPPSGVILEYASCITPGAIQAPANSINKIATPQNGFLSVRNPIAATPGKQVEEDSQLRSRRALSVVLPSKTPFDTMISRLKTLDNVLRLTGYENDTGNTIDTIPPHSIAIVIEGGEENQIADIIYKTKTPGTGTFGDISITVTSEQGVQNIINFSRPEYIVADVSITIKDLGTYTDVVGDKIKENVLSYLQNFSIGEDLYVTNLSGSILTANTDISRPDFYISGISVNSQEEILTVGKFQVIQPDITKITVVVNK